MSNLKIGNYVRFNYEGSELIETFEEYMLQEGYLYKNLELWKPKVGEWCWFYSKSNSRPHIDKFKEMKDSFYKSEYWTDYFTNCAPFIGELPEILK